MARVQPSVVPMSPCDVGKVAQMWVRRRVEAGASEDAAQRMVDEGHFSDAVSRPYVIVLLAVLDGDVVGYAWVCSHAFTPQMDVPSMGIEDMFVEPERRGLGVGRALIAAVASYAQKRGVDHVGCAVPAQDKDTNRNLTRMGFATVTTRRVAQASVLLRRLRGPEPRNAVDQLLIQRRRRAQLTRPAPAPAAAVAGS